MRMFVAIRPPEVAAEHLDAFLDVRRGAGAFRWTDVEQFHLTLAFLAEVPDRALDDLVERLGRAAGRRRPLSMRIGGGGAFPNAARARVLWAGLECLGPDPLEDREELRRIAVGARAAASKAGVEVDGAKFRPHLTVARLGVPREATNWVRLLDAYLGPSFEVAEVELVASYLGEGRRGRPRHEVIETFSLSGTGRDGG